MIKRKKLPSKEVLESFFYVDSDEGVLIWRFHPVLSSLIGKRVQGSASNKYTKVTVPGYGQFYLHRIIWLYVNGSSPDVLDHINRDKSDNRISNLRECTASENEKNKVSFRSMSKMKMAHLYLYRSPSLLMPVDTRFLADRLRNSSPCKITAWQFMTLIRLSSSILKM